MPKPPARRTRGRKPFPAAGSAFGLPLEDGRWGICRVIAVDPEGRGGWVAATEWVGTEAQMRRPAALRDPRTRAVLVKTHHSWHREPEAGFHSEPPPPELVLLGVVAPRPTDRRYVKPVPADDWNRGVIFGSWRYGGQMLLEWRWRHQRRAVLAEDAAAEAARTAATAREQAAAASRPPATLASLRRLAFFASWRPDQPRELILAARAIVHGAIDELRRSEVTPGRARRLLAQAVRALNRLDSTRGHFIQTIEREEIDQALFSVAESCGLEESDYERTIAGHFDF